MEINSFIPLGQKIIKQRNFWLDVCRSLAIIMVLMSHGRHFLTPAWEDAAVFRIGGFLGVELFFVLSGFLIGNIVWSSFKHSKPHQPWILNFISRRGLRTLPNYYLFLLINALLISNAVVPGRISDLLPFMVFVQNLAWPHPLVFGEAWSLAVEEIFYLILPLCMVFFGLLISNKRTAFLSVTLFLLLLPLTSRLIAVGVSEPLWDVGIRKIVVFRLDALMVGVLASWLVREYQLLNRIKRAYLLPLAILLIGGAVAVFFLNEKNLDTDTFTRVWLFPMVSIGCVLFVISGLTLVKSPAIIGKPAEIIARWSYALYLTHMPVFHVILWSQGHAEPGNTQEAFIQWATFIAGSVCVAALVERFFERPILKWRDRIAPQ